MTERSEPVALVCMPYASLARPSMALGLLKSVLCRDGIGTVVHNANVWFAERVGLRLYHLPVRSLTHLLMGEWIFAGAALGEACPDPEGYLEELVPGVMGGLDLEGRGAETVLAELRMLRDEASLFVDEAAARIVDGSPRIVGCSSTFDQQLASLALLRRVRQLDPEIVTMLGGANCETTMGQTVHRCFPWVDYVVSGEADGLISDLCARILERGRNVKRVDLAPGVLGPCHRSSAGLRLGREVLPRATFQDLDALPVPDFDEYFDDLEHLPWRDQVDPGLPMETARGCWWGERHHCTFCGLNGTSMAFHSKSPQRVLGEMAELEERYGVHGFEFVDNILDTTYYKTVLPALAESGPKGRRLFYEIKANVTRKHMELLAAAEVTWIQPGIESLHTDVLRLMDKGVQAWKNIQLLKWARELGLRVSWAVLCNFPGEQDEWYEEMANIVPYLEHLQAPGDVVPLRFDRFSVYHERRAELGLDLRPVPAMRHLYPLPDEDLAELTYYFADANDGGDVFSQRPGLARMRAAVHHWRREFLAGLPPVLYLTDFGDHLEIVDTRAVAPSLRQTLEDLDRMVCLACDVAPTEEDGVRLAVAQQFGVDRSAKEIAAATQNLLDAGLAIRVDGRIVGLGLRSSLPRLPRRLEFPGGWVMT